MDEGKFVADFIAANIEKIVLIGKKAYGKFDASVQTTLKVAYTDYLNASRLKHSKSKSFFIRNQPVELYSYYVPSGIACGEKLISKPSFLECTEFSNRVVISGTGGSGKSILMKHLFLDCIQDKRYTPILIELRDLNNYENSLHEYISENLTNFGFKANDEYLKKANQAGHFCYFFDGFDELTPKLRNKTIQYISVIVKKYTNCPVFISSRPDDVLNGLDDFSTFQMQPLLLHEAIELVQKLPFDEAIKEKFCINLSNGLFQKHTSFLSNPLLLSIMLLTYGENAEIPSKLSIFYNQAYEALFRRHDAYKGGYSRERRTDLDIQDFSRVFSLFCLQTYQKRLFKMSRLTCIEIIEKSLKQLNINANPNDYLSDLLSAACLMIEDGLEIAFSHRSFQEYFVALQISNSSPEIQIKLIDMFWLNLVSDNVMNLLREINPDLFERALLLPKLEDFFNELKVKKNIGITHFLRYIKLTFACIEYTHHDEGGISFVFVDDESVLRICQNKLRWIAAYDYGKFKVPTTEEISKKNDYMFNKYFREDNMYLTETLSIRSPIVVDLNKSNSWHSVANLSAAYGAYKALKSKHTNLAHSFNQLLGIK